ADYREVYNRVLAAVQTPVVLHWLGTAFDPQLQGYFGSEDWRVAADTLIEIISANPGKVAGVKMSPLDAQSELAVRARLPEGVRMLTGDDYNYVDLIGGEALVGVDGVNHAGKDGETLPVFQGHSDALLGAFAALVAPASAALQALDAGKPGEYERILRPTEELSRQIFARPTFYYKTGVFFIACLHGFQPGFSMVGCRYVTGRFWASVIFALPWRCLSASCLSHATRESLWRPQCFSGDCGATRSSSNYRQDRSCARRCSTCREQHPPHRSPSAGA